MAGLPCVRHLLDSYRVAGQRVPSELDTQRQHQPVIVWGGGPNANVSSASIAEMLREGLDAPEAFVGNKADDVKAAAGRRVRPARPYRLCVLLPRAGMP
jgi:hypothetical protein